MFLNEKATVVTFRSDPRFGVVASDCSRETLEGFLRHVPEEDYDFQLLGDILQEDESTAESGGWVDQIHPFNTDNPSKRAFVIGFGLFIKDGDFLEAPTTEELLELAKIMEDDRIIDQDLIWADLTVFFNKLKQ